MLILLIIRLCICNINLSFLSMLDEKLYNFLLKKEKFFNAELYYLATGQKKVVCVPNDAVGNVQGFWICTYSDENLTPSSAEWNIARLYGNCYKSLNYLDLIPCKDSFEFLVPCKFVKIFINKMGFKFVEKILFFYDKRKKIDFQFLTNYMKSLNYIRLCNLKFATRGNALNFSRESCVLPNKAIKIPASAYLLKEDRIISYLKITHITPNTAEIYVETAPFARNKGLATSLINIFRLYLYLNRKHLVYVVNDGNQASKKVAMKLGLSLYLTLARIVI